MFRDVFCVKIFFFFSMYALVQRLGNTVLHVYIRDAKRNITCKRVSDVAGGKKNGWSSKEAVKVRVKEGEQGQRERRCEEGVWGTHQRASTSDGVSDLDPVMKSLAPSGPS